MTASAQSAAVPVADFQQRWIDDRSDYKIAVKSRRVGFTFATTLEIAFDATARRTRWLIISRTQDTAKEAASEISNHLRAMKMAEAGIIETGAGLFFENMEIHKFVISLPNSSEITAMTAHPDAARGFGGNVFLDEFGFHRDSFELWKGAAAATMRGDRLIVVSTPHYQTGKYYEIARDCDLVGGHPPIAPTEDGKLWSAHWVDVYTAAPQLAAIQTPGFGKSVELRDGRRAWIPDADAAIARLHKLAGDEETWNQEYCCQFLSAAEMWISLELIAGARSSAANAEWYPDRECAGALYVGADLGRKRDRTAVWIDERIGDVAFCRGLVSLDRTSFEEQHNFFCRLFSHPRFKRACLDATGLGMPVVERLQRQFGGKVEGVMFTMESKESLARIVKQRFEEKLDKIPENAPQAERDIAAIKRETTASGNLRFDAIRSEQSHADYFWAKALADTAADQPRQSLAEYGQLVGVRRPAEMQLMPVAGVEF